MRTWLKRTRGLIGLGVMGALVGGGLFGVVSSIASFSAYGTVSAIGLLAVTLIGGFFGAATTTGLGLFLAVTARGKSIGELSLWPGMVAGAVICGGVVVGATSLMSGALPPLGTALSQLLGFGGFGAVLTGGLLVAARRANQKELEQGVGGAPRIEP